MDRVDFSDSLPPQEMMPGGEPLVLNMTLVRPPVRPGDRFTLVMEGRKLPLVVKSFNGEEAVLVVDGEWAA